MHTAVWTGDQMLVWGGYQHQLGALNSGGAYDPVLNTWSSITLTGAPTGRYYHTAVWTGSRMLVYGGIPGWTYVGGSYDPVANTWNSITAYDVISLPRDNHTSVWTGDFMIAWGGSGFDSADSDSGEIFTP